ncbi:MAG TPA: GNAT family N-acetyltransferase [Caulobacteraceae bacterium]|nr:GNAT family N-acetyltransferase [Caulobacteraceae bacterium]
MVQIRAYREDDLDAIYRICLMTGASGQDASQLYKDPKIIGHVYAGPYGVLQPQSALVVEDEEGVGGYIIGARDTPAFEAELEEAWWPRLRDEYPDPVGKRYAELTWDERMQRHIHHPTRTPPEITQPYPAHLHIDLLPRFQGRGLGKILIDRWFDLMRSMGARGVHLGVGTANERGVRFYRAYGFKELDLGSGALIFALPL